MKYKRRLGQHILHDDVLQRILIYASPTSKDIVFEIGTGPGNLTRILCEKSGRVISYELDERMHELAKNNLAGVNNLDIILGDAFAQNPKFTILVSNLPYNYSLRFIEWIIKQRFKKAIVTLQKEFVEKLIAKPGSERYRGISVVAQANLSITLLEEISPENFDPIPHVSSIIISLKPKTKRMDLKALKFVKILFSFRGRKLSNALKKIIVENDGKYEEIVQNIEPLLLSTRVEKLEVYEVMKIVEIITMNELKNSGKEHLSASRR